MNIKLKKTIGILIGFTIGVYACIREDVMLPPVVEPLSSTTLTSGSLITLKGNYLGGSALLFVNDTLVNFEGEATLTQVQFIVPFVRKKKDAFFYITTDVGSSSKQTITILPPIPFVKKVIPHSAPVGRTIKITGSYFEEPVVQFKSSSQSNWIEVIPTFAGDTLLAVVPEGLAPDAADIRVKTQSGESMPSLFFVLVPPTISNVVPLSGGVDTQVTLTGEDFDNVKQVLFGSMPAEIVTNSTTQLVVRVPEGTLSDNIIVETEGGSHTYPKKFTVVPKPTIEAIDKKSGYIGMNLNIIGQHFEDASEVRFGNTRAAIKSKTANTIQTEVPSGAQSSTISVISPGGMDEWDELFLIEGTPLISAFEPLSGAVNTVITLTGLNLSTVTKAMIGLYELDILKDSQTDNQLKVKVRNGTVTGQIIVSGHGGPFETPNVFTITGSPRILEITPNSGIPGTIATIKGENLPDNPEVKFADGVIAHVSSATSDRVVCQVPSNAKTGRVTIHGALSPTDFTITTTPTIVKIIPLKGGTGKEVTITGAHLKGARIKFHNNIEAIKTVDEDTHVVVTVPASATTGKIIVTGSGASVTSVENFEVIGQPTITSCYPSSGTHGTTVAINGTNLHHNPVVMFYNQINAEVKSISSTQILVEVPPGASTGPLSIKTDALNLAKATTVIFTVVGKPAITTVSPSGGGTIKEKVIINGNNFGNVSSVSFDGVATSQVLESSDNHIVVRIPATVNGSVNRTINVLVKTANDVSGNFPYSLLGTPEITRISPVKNPKNWAFLIEGKNLGSVRKISIGGSIPVIENGNNGIDEQAYNFITTKVPTDIAPSASHKLRLHYTSEDSAIWRNYEVLNAPPPGVFPPPHIILPPPIPSNFVQTDLSDYWINEYYPSPTADSVLSCHQLRANFVGEPVSGDFCRIIRFNAEKVNGVWEKSAEVWGEGGWDNGKVELRYSDGVTYKGQLTDQSKRLVLEDNNGYQLILIHDKNERCMEANDEQPGPCN